MTDCGEVTVCFNKLRLLYGIKRVLSHQETGHNESYKRDKRVKSWCKFNQIEWREFPQLGVLRGLRSREDLRSPWENHWEAFVSSPEYPSDIFHDEYKRRIFVANLVRCGQSEGVVALDTLRERECINNTQDRPLRQRGGEDLALTTLSSFLHSRGQSYSSNISSPESSWRSCSRLSAYLAWGHVSLRVVVQALRQRKQELSLSSSSGISKGTSSGSSSAGGDSGVGGGGGSGGNGGDSSSSKIANWIRNLDNFANRLRWRSHFIQKFEMEVQMEHHSLCRAYDSLRPRDHAEGLRLASSSSNSGSSSSSSDRHLSGMNRAGRLAAFVAGKTGFVMVDACIRSLHATGWLNFRMRAMLASFAAYNLWLDWR